MQLKRSIIDPKLIPLMVVLNPKLMAGLPPAIAAATGMDALTHAVEVYIASTATAETDQLAKAATVNILHNLSQAYSNGKDLMVRECMAIGACTAGLAFTLRQSTSRSMQLMNVCPDAIAGVMERTRGTQLESALIKSAP